MSHCLLISDMDHLTVNVLGPQMNVVCIDFQYCHFNVTSISCQNIPIGHMTELHHECLFQYFTVFN